MKPTAIRSTSKDTLTVEIQSKKNSDIMLSLSEICNIEVETVVNASTGIKKALIYIREYDMNDF